MAIYVNKSGGFEQAEPIARECPHCGAHAQLLPVAVPSFAELTRTQPKNVGLVFRCAACGEPRFVRATVRSIGAERVELAAHLVEIERPRERFQFGYLPASVEQLLRETLDCYTAGTHNAFASMCRRTVRAALTLAEEDAPQRWRDARCRRAASRARSTRARQRHVDGSAVRRARRTANDRRRPSPPC